MNLVSWDTSRALPCGGIIACKFRSDLAKLGSYSWKRDVVLPVKKRLHKEFLVLFKNEFVCEQAGEKLL